MSFSMLQLNGIPRITRQDIYLVNGIVTTNTFQCVVSFLSCEVIRLDCDLLLMDTVNVSSRVRTIAYTMYRTPVQYSIHYLCNVNNTPSSDS